jgi:acyl-CoA thioesterase-2
MSREQRRGRKIAMHKTELDAFLAEGRTCRVATASSHGPHLTPLWYVWDGTALWLTSLTRSQRWIDLQRDARIAVLVDAGEDYAELRGAELRGTAEVIGEVPRTGVPDPRLDEPERLFARKYRDSDAMKHDGRHAWLRLVPDKISSWDFRKLDAEQPADSAQRETEPTSTAGGSSPLPGAGKTASPRLTGQGGPQERPSILELMDLEYVEENLFRSSAVFHDPNRLYGGQVAAQALYAAGLTVPEGRLPHSLHGYFLREGNALRPTVFQVERDRDGRSFSARRVVAIQDGAVIFNMSASFAAARPGADLQATSDPEFPVPDLMTGWCTPRHPSFEFRSSGEDRWPTRFWIRCTADLPDDPLLHAAVLTYTTDISSGLIALRPPGVWSGGPSLDHAVWFHRPVRMDDWNWHDLVPHTAAGGRGLYTGAIYAADGTRVASTAQEALFGMRRVSAGLSKGPALDPRRSSLATRSGRDQQASSERRRIRSGRRRPVGGTQDGVVRRRAATYAERQDAAATPDGPVPYLKSTLCSVSLRCWKRPGLGCERSTMSSANHASESPETAPGRGMWFEDFVVGQRFESPHRTITAADVDAFARISGDTHPMHTDPAYASTTRFGRPVVHGPFGLAAFFGLFHETGLATDSIVALLDTSWRYLKPLFAGDSVQFRMTITRCQRSRSGSRGTVNRHVLLLNQHDEVVQEGTSAMLVRARHAGPDAINRAFCTVPWGAALAARLNDDPQYAAAVGNWDGAIGLRFGQAELQLRIYRGRVIDVAPRLPAGATFTVEADEVTWADLLTGPPSDFMRGAMAGAFRTHGSGYDYLRLTRALVLLVEHARQFAFAQDEPS